MTDLNKKLCEICAIDYEKNRGKVYFGKTCVDVSFKLDFSKPINFCKLINLIYKCGINQPYDYQLAILSADEDFYVETEQYENFQDRYLEVLLYVLSRDKDNWDKEFSKKIKQKIRQEEWKYG